MKLNSSLIYFPSLQEIIRVQCMISLLRCNKYHLFFWNGAITTSSFAWEKGLRKLQGMLQTSMGTKLERFGTFLVMIDEVCE